MRTALIARQLSSSVRRTVTDGEGSTTQFNPLLLDPFAPFIPQRTDMRPLVPSMTLR